MIEVAVVEKDPSLARLYQEEFEEAGFSVKVFSDLSSARHAMKKRRYQVMVTDLVTMGRRPEYWLPVIREFHRGPVLGISSTLMECEKMTGFQVVAKSSDLRPLISSIRGQAVSILWGAGRGTC